MNKKFVKKFYMGTVWVLMKKRLNFSGVNLAIFVVIKQKTTLFSVVFMVDDTRLELVTSRTSSGCATSCANRPGGDKRDRTADLLNAIQQGNRGISYLLVA